MELRIDEIIKDLPDECMFDTTPDYQTFNRVTRSLNPDNVSVCVNEALDNFVSAKATEASINCDEKTLVFYDNGHSISSREFLSECLTVKQNPNPGKSNIFGYGWNNLLTSLSTKAYILCRPDPKTFVIGLFDTNKKEHVTPCFYIDDVVAVTQSKFKKMWDDKAPNGKTTGTLQVLEGLHFEESKLKDYVLGTSKKSVGSWYYGVHKQTGLKITYNGAAVKFLDPLHRDLGAQVLLESKDTYTLNNGTETMVGINVVKYPKKGRTGRSKFPRINVSFDGKIHGTDVFQDMFGKSYGKQLHLFPSLSIFIDFCAREVVDTGEVPITANKTLNLDHHLGPKMMDYLLKERGLKEVIENFAKSKEAEPIDDESLTKDCNKSLEQLSANAKLLPSRIVSQGTRGPRKNTGSNSQGTGAGSSRSATQKNTKLTRKSTSCFTVKWKWEDVEGMPAANFETKGKRIEISAFANHPMWKYVTREEKTGRLRTGLGKKTEPFFLTNIAHIISMIEIGLANEKSHIDIQKDIQEHSDIMAILLKDNQGGK